MNTNATKLTYTQFERDFESISLFYFDRHFTQVTEDGLVYCYGIDDYMASDDVWAVMSKWPSVFVFYKHEYAPFAGVSMDDINNMNK